MVSLSRRNSERCSEIEKMKNKREDRFEAIVDQFVKNDLIAQEEYLFSQAVFMGSMLIILLLTALWKYKIDGKLNELKRCFWILGGVSLAIVLDIFVKSEAVMCGIGYSCFAMILLWFISMVRTKE